MHMQKIIRNLLLACLFIGGCAIAVSNYVSSVRREQPIYIALEQPSPSVQGKIEVIEFFWYGCPHCYQYEPVITKWARKHADVVTLRRIPAGLHDKQILHQKLYYTLAALNRLGDLHQASYAEIHDQERALNSDATIASFAREHGIDPVAWRAAFDSDTVRDEATGATALQRAYQATHVPSVAIGGRFLTSPSMVGMSLPYLGQTDEQRYEAVEKLMDDLLLQVKQRNEVPHDSTLAH
jgi:thiol:disulfide interchange protein DsbA